MSHVDSDPEDIVLDEVAEDEDEEEPKRGHQKERQEKQQQQPQPTPSSPPLTATVEEDDETVVPVEEEDFYSGPNKVLRLPLRVSSGSLLNSSPQANATTSNSSAEIAVPPLPPPSQPLSPRQPVPPPLPSLLASSSNVLFGFFRQLHCEICQLSAPLLVLLFAYLVALMYLALL